MSKKHDELCEEAEAAIDRVMGDTSVSQEDTIRSLRALREHIEVSISCIESDLKRDQE